MRVAFARMGTGTSKETVIPSTDAQSAPATIMKPSKPEDHNSSPVSASGASPKAEEGEEAAKSKTPEQIAEEAKQEMIKMKQMAPRVRRGSVSAEVDKKDTAAFVPKVRNDKTREHVDSNQCFHTPQSLLPMLHSALNVLCNVSSRAS